MIYHQLDMFADAEPETAAPVLNGMYYEQVTDMFVSFVLGKRHYQEPAKGCQWTKDWQEKTKRERSI